MLDGVYTLHTIKTGKYKILYQFVTFQLKNLLIFVPIYVFSVGVRIIDEWCKKVGPFFQIPVGPVNVYCIGDASIAQVIFCQEPSNSLI